METHQNYERLFATGLIPEEIKSLEKLRSALNEREREKLRRLEFVRWLVSTGRLTDGLPKTNG